MGSLREYGLIGLGLLHQDLRDLMGSNVSADPASFGGLRVGVDERTDVRPFDEAGTVSQLLSPTDITPALAEAWILVANRDWFETLSEDSRAAFRATVRDMLDRLNAGAEERIDEALSSLREAGTEVIELDFEAKG